VEDYPGPKVEIVEVSDRERRRTACIGQRKEIGKFRAVIGEDGEA
jgi:hypothetical protein